jgi:hypothetical protein
MPTTEGSLRARRAGTCGRWGGVAPGIPGHADDWGGIDRAEHDRVAGTHGDPVHGQLTELVDHPSGVVVAAGAGPGDHENQVRGGCRVPHRRADLLLDVGLDGRRPGLAAGLVRLRDQHQRVGVEDLVALWR